jgi:acid phosphatase type 7
MDRLGDASKIALALLRETMSTTAMARPATCATLEPLRAIPRRRTTATTLAIGTSLVLNSECDAVGGCGAGSAQEQWLRQDLKDHPVKCTLAYWHKPLFSSGAAHGNAPEMKPVWDALYSADAEIVIGGHDHDYERFAPQDPTGKLDLQRGIREFVVGTGGKNSHRSFASPKPNSEVRQADTFGVLKLTLHPASYDWEFVPEAGKTFTDSGSGTCH